MKVVVVNHCRGLRVDRKLLAKVARFVTDRHEVTSGQIEVAIMDDKEYAYRGTFTEIGCALGSGIPVIIFCPHSEDEMYARTNCFFCHPSIRHSSTWEDTLAIVRDILD